MKYGNLIKMDCANGYGIRTTLFVSGCTHKCEGCFNEDSQNFNYGKDWTQEVEDEMIKYAQHEQVVAVSILGGEPFQQDTETMLKLLRRIKEEVKKPVWIWTGYTIEELLQKEDKVEILKLIDVLVDGRFELAKRDLMLLYKGSSNQRILDVKKTLINNYPSLL